MNQPPPYETKLSPEGVDLPAPWFKTHMVSHRTGRAALRIWMKGGLEAEFAAITVAPAVDAAAHTSSAEMFLVQGFNPEVPGNPMSLHSTLQEANARAAELVNVILEDGDHPTGATAETWRGMLKYANERRAEDSHEELFDVWIIALELNGAGGGRQIGPGDV